MKLELLKQKETPLLSRKRATLMAEYQGPTPSRDTLRDAVAKKLDSDKKLTVLKHIYTRFGKQKAKIIAHVYDNEADLKKLERPYIIKKHAEKEAPKDEAKPEAAPAAEAPKEEAKPEEKKEEAPKEEKAEAPAEPEKKEEEKPAEAPTKEAKPEEKSE